MARLIHLLVVLSVSLWAEIPSESRQLLVVTTGSWKADHGMLQRYERAHKGWREVGRPVAVKVGKNGLAWGRGLHRIPKGSRRIKHEGDGRAPAGIFRLPYAFGERAISIRYPYHRMTSAHRCVDDSNSRYYNQIIDSRNAVQDYRSFERMKFASGLYSYGLFVAHNPRRLPKAGSCIFLHIKKPDGRPTVGCTAMAKEEIVTILKWLDPEKHPLLLQAPKGVVERLWR